MPRSSILNFRQLFSSAAIPLQELSLGGGETPWQSSVRYSMASSVTSEAANGACFFPTRARSRKIVTRNCCPEDDVAKAARNDTAESTWTIVHTFLILLVHFVLQLFQHGHILLPLQDARHCRSREDVRRRRRGNSCCFPVLLGTGSIRPSM